ncbi:MAG: phosphotransferase [Myxococcales bacterium]|nr:phosphotransferase [Myxococcales bacterium]
MIPFEAASYRAQVARLRQVALVGLAECDLKPERVRLVNHGENATFDARVVGRDGKRRRVLVRVHRRNYQSSDAIEAEIAWLELLRRDLSINVPRPIQSRSGRARLRLDGRGLDGPRDVVLFEWMEGSLIGTRKSSYVKEFARLIARIHTHSEGNVEADSLERWTVNSTSYAVGDPKWGTFDELERDDPELAQVWRPVIDVAYPTALEIERSSKPLLCHADLHAWNLLRVSDGDVGLIDFDDCGFAHPMMDCCVFLNQLEAGDVSQFWMAYREVRAIAEEHVAALPHFIALRRLGSATWLNSRRKTNARLDRYWEAFRARSADFANAWAP